MYPKEYFIEQFRNDETEDLLHRYATGELTDAARAAIRTILGQRGLPEGKLEPLLVQARKTAYRHAKGTSECDYCGKSAGYAPTMNGGQQFCSKTCLRDARLMEIAADFSEQEVIRHANQIRHDACPVCRKHNGVVEFRKHHRIWSAIIFSSWSEGSSACCKSCGRQENLNAIAFCLVFGWWSLRGIFMTPVQILANITEAFRADGSSVSDELIQAARLNLANAQLKRSGRTIENL